MSQRTAAAFHEAGHAVVCIVLGGRFDAVALEDGGAGWGAIEGFRVPSLSGHAAVTLAGPLAEARWIVGSGASPAVVAEHRLAFAADVDEEAADLAPYLVPALGEPGHGRARWLVDDLRPITETLVAAYWPAIEATARALEAGRTLTASDVCAIVRATSPLGTYPLAA